MTYIKVNNDLTLTVTEAEVIYQGENLSKSVTFLVPKVLNDMEVRATIAYLIYIRADGHPNIALLEREEEDYNGDYHQYIVTLSEAVTRYPGEVTLWIEFFSGLASAPTILRTGPCGVRITEHPTVSDSITDSQIAAIYQLSTKILETEDDITPTYNDVILF